MQMINPKTLQLQELPSSLIVNGVVWYNPTQDIAQQSGWMIPVWPPDVADGYRREWCDPAWKNNNDGTASLLFNDTDIADEQAAQAEADAVIKAKEQEAQAEAKVKAEAEAAEKQTEFLNAVQQLVPFAQQYRLLLGSYFGPGAEMNRTITQIYVLAYFAELDSSGTITAQQAADGALLQTLFTVLTSLANDPTLPSPNTWSSNFWNLIPQPQQNQSIKK